MSAPTRSATARARSASMSETTSLAPASASRSQSGPPTAPVALDDDRPAARIVRPERVRQARADPVEDADRGVGRRRAGPAGADAAAHHVRAPLPHHVHVAPRWCSCRTRSRSSRRATPRSPRSARASDVRSSPCGIAGTASTDFPPPNGRSAMAFLNVMAAERRSTSPERILGGGVRLHPRAAEARDRAPWSARRRTSRSTTARRSASRRTRRPTRGSARRTSAAV